jgi:hypothetical protein
LDRSTIDLVNESNVIEVNRTACSGTSEQNPMFVPINRDVSVLVANAEMLFEPSPTGRTRPARELSDGQQSEAVTPT